MISPQATELIIRHFDQVDRAVAARMNRKRPWIEPALTSLLCDLLDADTQEAEHLEYTLRDLNRELSSRDGLISLSFEIQTHEYDSRMEHWVTQADLGFVLRVIDYLLPQNSFTVSWLLQAKRFQPDSRNPLRYSEVSRLGAADPAQEQRIQFLVKTVGVPFVKYLLFCPRPSSLDDITRKKLAHLRNQQLDRHIFDYALGLLLRRELDNDDSSLSAGVFIASVNGLPRILGRVHSSIFQDSCPLSWFLAAHLASMQDRFSVGSDFIRVSPGPPDAPNEWAHGIVTGDPRAVRRLVQLMPEAGDGPFAVLPAHTLTINVAVGHDLDPELRRIRTE